MTIEEVRELLKRTQTGQNYIEMKEVAPDVWEKR